MASKPVPRESETSVRSRDPFRRGRSGRSTTSRLMSMAVSPQASPNRSSHAIRRYSDRSHRAVPGSLYGGQQEQRLTCRARVDRRELGDAMRRGFIRTFPPGRNDFQVAQVLDLAGRDGHVAEELAEIALGRSEADAPYLSAGDESLDAEPAVAADPDRPPAGSPCTSGRSGNEPSSCTISHRCAAGRPRRRCGR